MGLRVRQERFERPPAFADHGADARPDGPVKRRNRSGERGKFFAPAKELRRPVASLDARHDEITRALDILLLGF